MYLSLAATQCSECREKRQERESERKKKEEEEEAAAAAHRSFSSLEYVLIKYRLIVWGLLCVKKERIKLKFEQTHFVEPFLQKVWTKSKAALFVNWKQTPCVILIQLTPKTRDYPQKNISHNYEYTMSME